MLGRGIGGAVLGAILLFVVGFLWWGMPTGPGSSTMRQVPQEAEFQAVLREYLPESGAYVVPMMAGEGQETTFVERHREGPLAVIVFHRGGKDAMDPMVMVQGFLHGLLCCVLAAAFLAFTAAKRGFLVRWGVVAFLGVFMAAFENLSGMVWWSEPPEWVAVMAGYNIVGWAAAGLPIAGLVKRGA